MPKLPEGFWEATEAGNYMIWAEGHEDKPTLAKSRLGAEWQAFRFQAISWLRLSPRRVTIGHPLN